MDFELSMCGPYVVKGVASDGEEAGVRGQERYGTEIKDKRGKI